MSDINNSDIFYEHAGECPICEQPTVFRSKDHHLRSSLVCPSCPGGSIPRERALALVLKRIFPDWKDRKIHESSPCTRGFTAKLKAECKGYIPTQFFPAELPGNVVRGYRNENLEKQTFADAVFDAVISLDVMEHVNDPGLALREISRTLVPNGYCLFTAPTYTDRIKSERCAYIHEDGTEEILMGKPEYHGNPVNAKGALVTFRYGYDFPDLIYQWSGLCVEVHRFYDPFHGIIGPMTEVYVCRKIG